jgi:hypothetical protein
MPRHYRNLFVQGRISFRAVKRQFGGRRIASGLPRLGSGVGDRNCGVSSVFLMVVINAYLPGFPGGCSRRQPITTTSARVGAGDQDAWFLSLCLYVLMLVSQYS